MSSPEFAPQFKQAFGSVLRQLRKDRGIDQRALAKKIGTTAAAVSNWELGKVEPETKHFRAVADVFGLELHQLFTLVDEEIGPSTDRVAEPHRATPPVKPKLYENPEWRERRAFTALVVALRRLDDLIDQDPRAWRARVAWLSVIGASEVVRELAGWSGDDWKAIHEDRVDYWRRPRPGRRSEEQTARAWLQRTFGFDEGLP